MCMSYKLVRVTLKRKTIVRSVLCMPEKFRQKVLPNISSYKSIRSDVLLCTSYKLVCAPLLSVRTQLVSVLRTTYYSAPNQNLYKEVASVCMTYDLQQSASSYEYLPEQRIIVYEIQAHARNTPQHKDIVSVSTLYDLLLFTELNIVSRGCQRLYAVRPRTYHKLIQIPHRKTEQCARATSSYTQ